MEIMDEMIIEEFNDIIDDCKKCIEMIENDKIKNSKKIERKTLNMMDSLGTIFRVFRITK